MISRSKIFFARALKKIPGGVNSPVRAWHSVGGSPLFISRAKGSCIFDADNRRYIDFVGSWGPMILGHANANVIRTVARCAANGTSFGAPTLGEVELAELVSQCVPSVEKLRLVSSGTEATMSAIRLARAVTNRSKVVKFDGCYHGHSDGLLVKAGSGIATLSLPDSPGVPASVARETVIAHYNHLQSVQKLFDRYGKDIAAVIVEPICGNMGVIAPHTNFLSELRSLTQRNGTLLIFDEVITGFRVALGGAQELYKVTPDLTCLGKILGGGLPLAAFGGRRRIMDHLAPLGPVYQAGTLSGNPLAVAAGTKTLQLLTRRGCYELLENKSRRLANGLNEIIRKHRMPATVNRVGSMLTLFFGVEVVASIEDARRCDRKQFASFFHGMLKRGIYLPPSPYEAWFISLAHSNADLDRTISAFDDWAGGSAEVDPA
jgi:glutamate-1-semialdehyde 2,1-aminomutase